MICDWKGISDLLHEGKIIIHISVLFNLKMDWVKKGHINLWRNIHRNLAAWNHLIPEIFNLQSSAEIHLPDWRDLLILIWLLLLKFSLFVIFRKILLLETIHIQYMIIQKMFSKLILNSGKKKLNCWLAELFNLKSCY